MSLYRFVSKESAFNSLFPHSACERVSFGKGNTAFSIEMIIKQVLEHNHQVSKVAKKLFNPNLKTNCNALQSFLYNSFQYKADAEAQLLRSPACAWQQRFIGIDCKTYSIVASSILLQQKIKHYIRKIKQPTFNAESYTHVYVIVPINQKTGNLKDGYYTIDGTLPTTTEPVFTNKKDFFMDLPHFGLNGADTDTTTGDPTTDAAMQAFSDVDFNKITQKFTDYFNFKVPIACWGGTAYNGEVYAVDRAKMVNYFSNLIKDFNNAFQKKDIEKIEQLTGVIVKFGDLVRDNFLRLLIYGNYNICSKTNYESASKVGAYYAEVQAIFFKYLNEYFDIVDKGETTIDNQVFMDRIGTAVWRGQPKPIYALKNYSLTLKPNVKEFTPFTFSDYVEQTINTKAPFDFAKYKALINKSVQIIEVATGDGSNGGLDTSGNYEPNKNEAGFGLIGWLLVASGLGYAFTQMKDKPKTSNATTKKLTSKKKK